MFFLKKTLHKNIKSVLLAAVATECGALEKGSLAQSVEQLTFNQLVGSSNLPRPTIFESLSVVLKWVVSSVGRAVDF